MYTATLRLTINEFLPINGPIGISQSIVAKIDPPTNISPYPYNGPGIFELVHDPRRIKIHTPKGYTGAVNLIFQLPKLGSDPLEYVLLGIALKPLAGGRRSTSEQEFPRISFTGDATGGELTLTDEMTDDYYFNFVILIQQVSTNLIGFIDPGIENEPS